MSKTNLSERVGSIDALRGFDMLMIIFADQFFMAWNAGANTPFTRMMANQFDHPEWYGSTFYDIIMPLFLFVVGAVIPFSLSENVQKKLGKAAIYRKLTRRFVILFVLGWVVQGNLLEWDLATFHVFSNTLQAIAVGYVFSALVFIHFNERGLWMAFIACLVLYALVLTVPMVPGGGRSVLLPDRNFAIWFDRWVLGRFDDGLQYTWLLTGLGFTATTLSGVFAGQMIRSGLPRKKVATRLVLVGLIALSVGLVWGIWHPIIKKIWTSSFVLASSGICFLLLAAFYYVIDVLGYQKWAFPLKVIGMNAITAYVLSHVIRFPDIAGFVLFGTEQFAGRFYPMLEVTGGFLILYFLLWYMYRNKTLIKI